MSEQAISPADEHGTDGDHGHDEKHYVRIWGLLLVLLFVSVAGPFLEIQVITLLTAFGIAVVKASMVVRYFMHINVQPKYVLYFLGTALVFMALLFFGTAPDILNHEGQNWVNVAAQDEIARALAEQGEGASHGAAEGEFDATATFATTCGVCHGTGGAGDGAAAASMDPTPADFTDSGFWNEPGITRNHEHIVTVIRDGGAAVGRSPLMAAFGGQFDEAQIEALANFVEDLNPNAE